MRPLVTRIRLLHGLGVDCKNVLQETPVRSTTQEVITHRHERSKIRDGIGREVVKLSTEKVQKTLEERMRRKGETTVDMGGKEHTLTRPRQRLYLVPRQPRSSGGDQARGGQIFQIL